MEFSLQYIHGIGRSRARKILCDLKMENKITKDLSEEELITIRDEVSKYMIEGDLVIANSPSGNSAHAFLSDLMIFLSCGVAEAVQCS